MTDAWQEVDGDGDILPPVDDFPSWLVAGFLGACAAFGVAAAFVVDRAVNWVRKGQP